MATEKKAPSPSELDAARQPDLEVIKTVKTEDGLRWHYEEEAGGVRTFVTTKDGRALNAHLSTKEAGRAHLRKFLELE